MDLNYIIDMSFSVVGEGRWFLNVEHAASLVIMLDLTGNAT